MTELTSLHWTTSAKNRHVLECGRGASSVLLSRIIMSQQGRVQVESSVSYGSTKRELKTRPISDSFSLVLFVTLFIMNRESEN